MEYEKIKQLMNDMENSKLTEISVELPDGFKVSMKKEVKVVAREDVVSSIEEKVVANNQVKNEVKQDENVNIIKSPMVGTFYSKSSPTSNAYVEIGKDIQKGETVCIIEAMKLMNEIESEFSGKILEVLVKDGQMVEYGTPLFKISKN